MKIIVKDEQELMQLAVNAIHILRNLRKTTDEWREHYGAVRRDRIRYFEEKADALIASLKIVGETQTKQPSQIEIKNDGEDQLS